MDEAKHKSPAAEVMTLSPHYMEDIVSGCETNCALFHSRNTIELRLEYKTLLDKPITWICVCLCVCNKVCAECPGLQLFESKTRELVFVVTVRI